MQTTRTTTLSGEEWRRIADKFDHVSQRICAVLIKAAELCDVPEAEMQDCCDEFATGVCLAVAAMQYVADHAPEQIQIELTD